MCFFHQQTNLAADRAEVRVEHRGHLRRATVFFCRARSSLVSGRCVQKRCYDRRGRVAAVPRWICLPSALYFTLYYALFARKEGSAGQDRRSSRSPSVIGWLIRKKGAMCDKKDGCVFFYVDGIDGDIPSNHSSISIQPTSPMTKTGLLVSFSFFM